MQNTKELDPLEDELEEEVLGSKTAEFKCPNCGIISQDDVIFTCNVCESNELIFKEGVYMCPQCLNPGENFTCQLCESKKVTLTFKEKK